MNDEDDPEQSAYDRGLITGFVLSAAMFAFLALSIVLAVISVMQ